MAVGRSLNPSNIPAPPSSAACSRRRSTTYIPAGVDSGLRRNDGGGNRQSPLTFILFLYSNMLNRLSKADAIL